MNWPPQPKEENRLHIRSGTSINSSTQHLLPSMLVTFTMLVSSSHRPVFYTRKTTGSSTWLISSPPAPTNSSSNPLIWLQNCGLVFHEFLRDILSDLVLKSVFGIFNS
ncbi:hypothetical protein ZOSMA_147G00020 [Zostera marina]|uniref:Uncharacterized protein n=1 Tax=Zostera marina TaxID=29655 RepID=A0A0K9PZ23_ZOSMR|nr:hypothetical protein ZOSMA_147G00020 [Zostera marina]